MEIRFKVLLWDSFIINIYLFFTPDNINLNAQYGQWTLHYLLDKIVAHLSTFPKLHF